MQGVEAEVEGYIARAAEQDLFSGVVLLARGGESVLSISHNQACRRFRVPNTMDTRFDIASVVKVFTAVAIGQLAEKGLVTFDAPIAAYLPDYSPAVAEQVRIHHLLTHTSGLGSVFDAGEGAPPRERLQTIDNIVERLQARPLHFPPGAKWEYSNDGYILLGAVIESVTAQPFFDYLRDHILAPAGMRDTGPYALDEEVPDLAHAYSSGTHSGEAGAAPSWQCVYRDWPASLPACCLYSTAPDLLRFSLALRRGELVNTAQASMLTDKKVQTGRRPGEHYAYGFFTEELGDLRVFGHGGMVSGFQAWFDMYPSLDYTSIVLTNFEHPAAFNVGWFVRTALSGVSPPVLS